VQSDIDEQAHDTTECVECAAMIPAGARLCGHCGSHQTRWRNEILFASTLVGIASVTVTAIAFLVSIWPEVTSVVAWRDQIEVVEFDALGTIVVANRGDGAVYVSDFRTTTNWGSHLRRASVVVEPGALSILRPDSADDATYNGYRSWGGIPPADSIGSYRGSDRCYAALVMSESSPVSRLWSSAMGEQFVTFDEPAEVVVRYHGISSGVTHEDTIAVPAVPALDPDCRGAP
jgi:ribosomal protein L40E